MPFKLSTPANIQRLLGLFVLLALGAGSGVVVGAASAAPSSVKASETAESESAKEAIEDSNLVFSLTVEESSPAPPPPGPAATAANPTIEGPTTVPARSGGPALSLAVSVPGAPATTAPTEIQCDRLDDAKIHWLLNLVAKTRAANPDMDQAGAHVQQQLEGALGKNMCAEEAQQYVGAMCADPAVYSFMQKMVQQLPFFVRPMVGDPCTQDLVAVANKYMR